MVDFGCDDGFKKVLHGQNLVIRGINSEPPCASISLGVKCGIDALVKKKAFEVIITQSISKYNLQQK